MKEFIFDEHIAKFDYSPIIEKLEKKLERTFFKWKKNSLKDKIYWLKQRKENTDNWYSLLSELFSEIKSQNRCKIGYEIFSTGDMQVFAEGSGIEKISTNGKPVFEKDENEKITKIPVTIGSNDDCNLTVYNQPQIELPMFGKLTLSYKFKADFYAFIEDNKTKDPEQTLKFNFLEHDSWDYYFYKKDGKICYRGGDGLHHGLCEGMLRKGYVNDNKSRMPEFNMYGQIHVGDTLFYQGNFECDSYWFPFCIKPDRYDRGNKEKLSVPKQPEAVKV